MKTYIIRDENSEKFDSISHIQDEKITSLRYAIKLANMAEKEDHKKAYIYRLKEDGGYQKVIFK